MLYELKIYCETCNKDASATSESSINGTPVIVQARCECGSKLLHVNSDFDVIETTKSVKKLQARISKNGSARKSHAKPLIA